MLRFENFRYEKTLADIDYDAQAELDYDPRPSHRMRRHQARLNDLPAGLQTVLVPGK